jgi:hypothetical protein
MAIQKDGKKDAMLFNDAMAIQKEGKLKRKAIHEATRAEQMEMDDISCDDEEWQRRMKADKDCDDKEWKRRNREIMETMRDEADEDWQRIERERKRRNRERMETMRDEADEDWQRIERERPSGNKPSGSGCGNRLDKTLPHWVTNPTSRGAWQCNICQGTSRMPILPICATCPVACHGSRLGQKEEEDALMTSIEAEDKAKFYCAHCQLDLNGAEDYAKHMAGKFHENRVPNLPIANIAMDLMHVMDLGIGSMLSSSSSSSK